MVINQRIALMVMLCASAVVAHAQPAAPNKARALDVNGIRVIVAPAYNQLVTVIVGLEGGLISGETDNPALADFTGTLIASSGSTAYPKDAMRRLVSETSTNLSGSGDQRGLTYTMTATRPNFDKAWAMLASLITAPAFDDVEFKNLMQRRTTEIKRRWTNPEGYASFISDSLVKLGHPVLGRVTEAPDLNRIDMATVRAFAARLTERSRMLIVIVGNVTPAEITKKLSAFASVPPGAYKRKLVEPLIGRPAPVVEVIDRPDAPTTYVQASFAGPRMDHPDFWPLQVGFSHLRNVLFEELRTKRNLTYAPGASVGATIGQSRAALSVSSTLPDSSIAIMYAELEKMKRGEIDADALNDSKQVFITSYYMRQMTNDGVAGAIYSNERNTGDWRRAYSFDAISAVNVESVRAAVERFASNLQVGVVGKASMVTKDKYLFLR